MMNDTGFYESVEEIESCYRKHKMKRERNKGNKETLFIPLYVLSVTAGELGDAVYSSTCNIKLIGGKLE